ncbi:hypothetical protein [Pseudarthrobacter enclensis]|uniref:Uncharacterized protein n=1 Tax=Pseudarthrobacter enclensis TaxID=993070 RepID=A0ABT9RWD8_9MICC|nr:hypothetical protein [Pseudarthrobacter enclensis]MDP9889567.1 hypothetical protein [Pseudarthrobacter enclensis]
MRADWVAASARARSMALHRIGAGASREVAAQQALTAALSALQASSYAERLHGVAGLAAAERAVQETVLWRLRVLAGWLPASGTGLARAAAGIFEIENIVALARELSGGAKAPAPYHLGTLATAWPRLRTARTRDELASVLAATAWGDVGAGGPGLLRDALNISWLRRLADLAPAARAWCGAASVLTAARILLLDGDAPSPRMLHLLRPVLGSAWESTTSIDAFTAAIPSSLRGVLDGVASAKDLWRAEARAYSSVEKDGFRLLGSSVPGPDVVLGAVAVLSLDAWRLRAALTAAAAGAGSSEVLDAAA